MTQPDVHGPVDFVLLEFPSAQFTGEIAHEIVRLLDAGIIRLFDLFVVQKQADGTFAGLALDSVADVGSLTMFAGARSGLLGDDDVGAAADAMEPGTTALLLVYENSWAGPFVAAARGLGGEMVASARIPAQDLIEALEALEH